MLKRSIVLLVIVIMFFIMAPVQAAEVMWGANSEILVSNPDGLADDDLQYLAYKDNYVFAGVVTSGASSNPSAICMGMRLFKIDPATKDFSEVTRDVNQAAFDFYAAIAAKADLRTSVEVSGNYLYAIKFVAGEAEGNGYFLLKIDVTDPENPILMGTPVELGTGGRVSDMQIVGDLLYVSLPNGFKIFNVAGTGLTEVSSDTSFSGISNVCIQVVDGYIYCVSQSTGGPGSAQRNLEIVKLTPDGTAIVDNTDPARWIRKTLVLTEDSSTSAKLADIYVEGEYAYISVDDSSSNAALKENNGVRIYNISNKTDAESITLKAHLVPNGDVKYRPYRLNKYGNILFVAAYSNAPIGAIDLSNPDSPTVLTASTAAFSGRDLLITGTLALSVNKSNKLYINELSIVHVDISSPAQNDEITTTSFTIEGTCSSGAEYVLLTLPDNKTAEVEVASDGSWSYEVTGVTENGSMVVIAESKDENDNTITSTTRTVIINVPYYTFEEKPTYSPNVMQRGEITATIHTTNPQGNPKGDQPVVLIMALFYDGKLYTLESDQKTVLIGEENIPLSTTVTVPEEGELDKYSIQVFVCADLENLEPLTKEFDFPNNTDQ